MSATSVNNSTPLYCKSFPDPNNVASNFLDFQHPPSLAIVLHRARSKSPNLSLRSWNHLKRVVSSCWKRSSYHFQKSANLTSSLAERPLSRALSPGIIRRRQTDSQLQFPITYIYPCYTQLHFGTNDYNKIIWSH